MPIRFLIPALCVVLFTGASKPPTVDLTGYRPQPGLEAALEEEALTLRWDGERQQECLARFTILDGVPTVRELAVRKKGGKWVTLGRNLNPEFGVTTGVRRTGHGLPESNRWDVFWDAPLNHPEEVRRSAASYKADRMSVRTDGARLEVSFPGLSMGIFSGGLRFTVYRGTNLLRLEAVAKTDEPSVAYIYQGGLKGFSPETLPRIRWHDASGERQTKQIATGEEGQVNVLRARNRLAIAEGTVGSIAVFPPPHQFFFARELEVNLGYVWHRRDGENAFSMGVRQAESAGGYNPVWIEQVYSLYNAPPGTEQRMPVYFYLSPDDGDACRESVMAFTHGDRYKPLPGYKTMATHFHTAFTQELIDSGNLDTTPPWIPMMRAMGINIAHIFDFHGDGHPHDPGPLRLKELATYFEGCRRHSDADFLILPGEEANVYLGGHYNILFPKPVYWTLVRRKDQPLVEDHASYGKVYHTGSAADVFELMKREGALVWTTHPRTKGSTGYPDKIKDTDYFQDDRWLGAAFKALPVDLSQKRLGEVRCFGTLDDMNNWGRPKFMVGEVDTYKKYPDYDLYGDFNVNYVKLDRVPTSADWSPIVNALRAGEFFVTTGEVLIPKWTSRARARTRRSWRTWSGRSRWSSSRSSGAMACKVDRTMIPATDQPPFGSHRFRIPFDPSGKKWVRFSVWDSAGNGAFTQPVRLP